MLCLLHSQLAGNALADDIDVYGVNGRGPGARLPNVLFVFDTSESMERGLDGEKKDDKDNPSKLDILHRAVGDMLDASEGRINVGITSFNETAQGIKWPVSSLDQKASLIDPAIDTGVTVKEVINGIIANDPSGGSTATVDALYEAARYFRSEPVWISGLDDPNKHRPHTWDSNEQGYIDGSDIAAHPASYSPINAHQKDAETVTGSAKACYDYTIGGTVPGATDYCAGETLLRCDAPAAGNRVWDPDYCGTDNATYEWTCTLYDATGSECIRGTGSCAVQGGYTGAEAHRKCYYNGASYSRDRWDGATYRSPTGQSCQANFIVLLTDGAPSESSARPLIKSLTNADCEPLSDTVFGVPDGSYDYGDCGPELARFLYENDQHPSIKDSRVTTYTIGFGLGGPGGVEAQNYLKLLAGGGGGDFLLADDSAELTDAFDRIVSEISGGSETTSGISVDVDKATGSHQDQAYLNLFQPSARRSWDGNLKGYYLRADGLHDQLDVLATELTADGVVFKDSARSFWSPEADGKKVADGGANALIADSQRRLVTNLLTSPGGTALADMDNRLSADNALLSPDLFGAGYGEADKAAMIDWLYAASMGDPMHSQPVSVRYSDRPVVFTMTNQGFLHAIDASNTVSGINDRELFAFMPRRLLSNVPALQARSYTGSHIYGLDGSISRWHEDTHTRDGLVNPGERVILFFGMRRGGSAYYALDVSDVDAPKLLWTIDPSVSGFANLGQSWSRMSLVNMPWQGAGRKMLVFGGGYDTIHDDSTTRTPTATGNAVYFVDPETGQLLWSVSANGAHSNVPSMQYSIPADLRVIDVDGNGIADRIYFGDLGGQIWRVKLDEQNFGNADGLQVTRLAQFSDDSEQSDRRFFYPPTAYYSNSAANKYLGISIGSGNRANPLSLDVQDRVYAIRDKELRNEIDPVAETELTHAHLVDVTSSSTDNAQLKSNLASGSGWYISLSHGEKSLSQIVAFEGQLLFTTYAPDIDTTLSAQSLQCSIAGSIGRFYAVNQSNATPGTVIDQSDNALTESHSRVIPVQSDGILGPPVIVFPEGKGAVDIYVDKHKVGAIDQRLRQIFWHAK